MGSVYRVIDLATSRPAALKMLSANAATEEGFIERFAREIEMLAKISHPNIPKVLGAGIAVLPYFISEFIHGRDLRTTLDEAGSLSAERVAAIGANIAEALAAAHGHGVIHRDIKPQNIIIDRHDTAFLIDFGIARAMGPDMRSLTETGMLLGTPHYMAPEQIDSRRVDERSDIYSLGVVLYEAATGRTPFSGTTPFAVARAHVETDPLRPRALKADIPPSLESVILRCLCKNPARRPWTATEVAALLNRPHKIQVRRKRSPNGDKLEEAPAEIMGYALRIISKSQKRGWSVGAALHVEQVIYKIVEEIQPEGLRSAWEYRCIDWPCGEVLRKFIDYDSEVLFETQKFSVWERLRRALIG